MAIAVYCKNYKNNEYFSSNEFEIFQSYKVFFLIKGNATYQSYDGINLSISSGEAIIIPPLESHRLSGTVSYYYEVHFDSIDVSSVFLPEIEACFQRTTLVSLGERKDVALLDFEKLCNEFYSDKKYKNIALWSILQKILIEFVRAFGRGNDAKNDGYAIMNVVDFIDKNYTKKITVEDMAKIALMSKSHFSCRFKKYVGITPNEYLNKTRISMALKYVCVSGITMEEVAKKVGMGSASYFCSQFKKYMKMSPKKYAELANAKIDLYGFAKGTLQ